MISNRENIKQEFLKLTSLTDEIDKLVEKDSEFNDEIEAFSVIVRAPRAGPMHEYWVKLFSRNC